MVGRLILTDPLTTPIRAWRGIALGEDDRTTPDPPPGDIGAELLDDLRRKLPENVVSAEELNRCRNHGGGPILA
jgi:hypothetical protein